MPTNLIWTNCNKKSNSRDDKIIINKMFLNLDYYCDLGEISSKDKILRLATEIKPFDKEHWINEGFEKTFIITLYAENNAPSKYQLVIIYKKWSDLLMQKKDEERNNFLKLEVKEI